MPRLRARFCVSGFWSVGPLVGSLRAKSATRPGRGGEQPGIGGSAREGAQSMPIEDRFTRIEARVNSILAMVGLALVLVMIGLACLVSAQD
jgi:hypothetical protein